MPSHGPTEPPDESHGWEDEYDKIMESEEGKGLLLDLCRYTGDELIDGCSRAKEATYAPVETDDDALQAFVKMVYDRGICHGHGNAQMEAGLVQMDKETKEQDRLMKVSIYEHVGGPSKIPVVVSGEGGPAIALAVSRSTWSPYDFMAKYVPGEQREEHDAVEHEPGVHVCSCGDPDCKAWA